MKILVISNNYPSNDHPNRGVFVYKIVQQFANQGNEVIVISPGQKHNSDDNPETYGEEAASVFRPYSLSFSAKKILFWNTYLLTEWAQARAVSKVVEKNNIEFDLVYCHFISNGFTAIKALSKYNKPIYVALGESNLDHRKRLYPERYFSRLLKGFSGFITVSQQLRDKVISYGVKEDMITVQPNAVDFSLFYRREKNEMREKLGLPAKSKIAVFVGRFEPHKGPLRILEAAKGIEGLNLVFIGKGSQELIGDNIIFKGTIPSHQVPEYLSASDLFVLPTQQEGSCNAIVEAMSCGLPIISSDIPEVQEQCNDEFSILVNPLSVTELRAAILRIIDNQELRERMSAASIKEAQRYDISKRARNILEFISS